jgi:transposase-like protein
MKEKDIYIDFKDHEIILYAEKEDESYGAVVCGSYAAKHCLGNFFDMKEKLDKSLREELSLGRISPIHYFMVMQDMGPRDLARRVGISLRKLRRHLSPDGFKKLDDTILQKYAVVFGNTVEKIKEAKLD